MHLLLSHAHHKDTRTLHFTDFCLLPLKPYITEFAAVTLMEPR
jgi:hypothetical protein